VIDKGIILAGGAGTRLDPLTRAVSKQLLPVYDRPLIYHPICTLMRAGIRRFLVINTPHEQAPFRRLLGDGTQWGIEIEYAVQPSPDGLAQAFLVGRSFIGSDGCALILGDNIFIGDTLERPLREAAMREKGATIFGVQVERPRRHGVVDFDRQGRVVNILEKPVDPPSSVAVPGLYFYDDTVVERATALRPSARGELEITDLNNAYLADGLLHLEPLSDVIWLDPGDSDDLLDAGIRLRELQRDQGPIGDPTVTARDLGWLP